MNANKETHSRVLAVETPWQGVCTCCFSASSAMNCLCCIGVCLRSLTCTYPQILQILRMRLLNIPSKASLQINRGKLLLFQLIGCDRFQLCVDIFPFFIEGI